ncbi:AraC family transcriptional regulator [Elizabethkingia anophelis]|uniref:AraC family transcriptional regulator n=1 Tax=Elizabethkingia anophelis TaxID=1117645 RepID=A0AAE4T4C6_9FLAO|nr:AraC family transcriptional regulator [Elizabethkingia anophelis]MCT4098519.1 AraC family transcriptional regulator [Elizabethkingia anophelis]MDV3664792.1 AraC family transcriptional regulator [Elizabethkingia anophelis]
MLYLAGIFLAFFFTFLLLTKRNKSIADTILACWLSIIGINLISHYLLITDQYLRYPSFTFSGFLLPITYGPFLYLYVRKQTYPRLLTLNQLFHFLPFIVCNFLFWSFYTASYEERVEIFKHEGREFQIQMFIRLYLIYLSGISYAILSFRYLYQYRKNIVKQFSNTDKINFNWLLYLILWISIIWVLVILTDQVNIIYGAVTIFIIWLGYFGIKQVHIFNQSNFVPINYFPASPESFIKDESNILDINDKKYQKSGLTEDNIEDIHSRLTRLLDTEKPFVNPNLTLNELAKMLDVYANSLSQVINSKEEKNFYELINEKRISEFLGKISDPENKQYTLLAIAFECGFNSKTSFNRNFKKYTGLTPSEYQKLP